MLEEESNCEMHTFGLTASLRYVKKMRLFLDSFVIGLIREV